MGKYILALRSYYGQLGGDAMLVMVMAAPWLAGLFFHFGLPWLDGTLLDLGLGEGMVEPWYPLADLFVLSLPAFLSGFASAMVMLEERDDGPASYLAITPLGRRGYLLTRLLIPVGIMVPVALGVSALFALSDLPWGHRIMVGISSLPQGAIGALVMFRHSRNRVEGLAVGKLVGVSLMGLAVPFAIPGLPGLAAAVFPSWWLSMAVVEDQWWSYLGALASFLAWTAWVMRGQGSYRGLY